MNGFAKDKAETPSPSLITGAGITPAENWNKRKAVLPFRNYPMTSYYHLPHEQRRVQQLVAQFSADEQLWRSLEAKRRRRRNVHPRMSAKLRCQLDLVEFASSRPLQDCVGQFSQT
jgi:hypothetical protein